MGKQTFLHYRKRRYHCPHCGKHFYEPFPSLPKHCRTTTRLLFYVISICFQNGRAFALSPDCCGYRIPPSFTGLRISVSRNRTIFLLSSLLMNLKGMPAEEKFRRITLPTQTRHTPV